MANNITTISYQPLILTGAGTKPTVPTISSLLPGDTGWVDASNILIGQTAYNVTENKYYIRSASGIELLKSTMYYEYDQGTPAAVWTIAHNLGLRPAAVVIDSAGTNVEGQIDHIDVNNLTLTFSGAFSGKAYLT